MSTNKLKLILVTVGLLSLLSLRAQTNLTGRVYQSGNIMQLAFAEAKTQSAEKEAQLKAKAVAEAEKKKGRKLTAEEQAAAEKKALDSREKTMALLEKNMTTSMTYEFKTEKDLVMRMDMKMDDEALKKMGVSWMKRKVLKVAMSAAPKSHKVTYEVQDNLVIVKDGKDLDTLRLSADGKQLTVVMDEKTIKLKRTK